MSFGTTRPVSFQGGRQLSLGCPVRGSADVERVGNVVDGTDSEWSHDMEDMVFLIFGWIIFHELFVFFSPKKKWGELKFRFFFGSWRKFLRFPSEMEPQWIEIDLEKVCQIDAVRVKWWGSLATFGDIWGQWDRNDNSLRLMEMIHYCW